MYKKLAVAVGAVAASQERHMLDIFHPTNFMTVPVAKTLLSQVIDPKTEKIVGGGGSVTWSQCPDDIGAFTFDQDSTTFTPNPLTKGSHLSLDLKGIVSQSITQDNVHVHVDWNKTTLYDNDVKGTDTFDSQYEFKFGWDVPSYAPNGDYAITFKGTEPGDKKSVMCVQAAFTFS